MTSEHTPPKTESPGECGTRGRFVLAVIAVVFLRICVGWHFLGEGAKKLTYNESLDTWTVYVPTEALLGQSVGPLAPLFKSMLPTSHNWEQHLAVAEEATPELLDKVTAQVQGYVKRRQGELKAGADVKAEFPKHLPSADWYEQISSDWTSMQQRFAELPGLSEDQVAKSEASLRRHERQAADILAQDAVEITEYQHDLWRLEQARLQPGASEIPFEQARLATLSMETTRAPQVWVASIKSLDEAFAGSLRSLLTTEQLDGPTGEKAEWVLTDFRTALLGMVNVFVTCFVTVVGICLLAGFATRIASLAGAGFLLSVMATQPPWVPGAATEFFGYQLVEFAAMLFLAAVGAGRWFGLDSFFYSLWSRCRGSKGNP